MGKYKPCEIAALWMAAHCTNTGVMHGSSVSKSVTLRVQSNLFTPKNFGHHLQLRIVAFLELRVQNMCRAIEMDTDFRVGSSDFWIYEFRIKGARL